MFPKDDIVPLLLKQNGLEGAHSTPHFRSKDKGVSIVVMGIAPQLVNGIRALGGRAGLGAMSVKINVKKESEETTETEKPSDQVDESPNENMETENVEAENITDWTEEEAPAVFNYESS